MRNKLVLSGYMTRELLITRSMPAHSLIQQTDGHTTVGIAKIDAVIHMLGLSETVSILDCSAIVLIYSSECRRILSQAPTSHEFPTFYRAIRLIRVSTRVYLLLVSILSHPNPFHAVSLSFRSVLI
jgi:hypothetical protein